MFSNYYGEWAALLVAVFWTITAIAFELASKKIGSLTVNLLRLAIAMILLGIYGLIVKGSFFPMGAGSHQWIWLSVSGLVGFVLGDLFLFQAYVVVGARISMLIMALAPPIAALTGWLLMGETIHANGIAGMILTFTGISLAILNREPAFKSEKRRRVRFKYPLKGILLAFGGAAGQGIGLVLSKFGMDGYDPFASTQIRVLTGVAGFLIVITVYGSWKSVKYAFTQTKALKHLTIGAFFGPFLGVSFSLLAIQYTSSGVASSIMSIVPVLIIAPSVFMMKEKVTWPEIIGAAIAVAGVVMFFI
ncbi:MAG TPA: EamA family transporter [Bacteroidales bacterium]|jgi:drug/metabolite transporter (DMT)-like permease|nr:DMT family transporter [Lentimicrobium sp.]HAH58192.1 EamA family transporter [Bacteroidales bacterium]